MPDKLLTRAEAIRSTNMPESTFDRLGIEPAKRSGRNVYFRVKDILRAVLVKEAIRSPALAELSKVSVPATRAAADALAEETLR